MKKLFIVTDYHPVNGNTAMMKSEHYCFEYQDNDKSDEELFDECVKQIPATATVCDWWVE